MAQDYHHGVRVIEVDDGLQTIRTVSTAVIGLVGTAPDAESDEFPTDTPVLVTDVNKAIGQVGSEGTLKAALTAIADQASPVTVVVRVDPDSDDETDEKSAIIGTTDDDGKRTGLQALLTAEQAVGVKPRILGIPGWDGKDTTEALASVAEELRAFAYGLADGKKVEDVIDYRDNFGSRELMLIWPDFTAFDPDEKQTKEASTIGRALGLRAYIDEQIGWHKTLSNVEVNGVSGISRDVQWSLQATGTDADLLNEKDVTTLIRQSGFRFWGSRTCSEDDAFQFESYTRTAQILADTIAEAQMQVIDTPMTPGTIRSIVDSVNKKGRQLVRQGYLLGFEARYSAESNSSSDLKAGKVFIDYDYTPVPPLENLNFQQHITDQYLMDFADRVNG